MPQRILLIVNPVSRSGAVDGDRAEANLTEVGATVIRPDTRDPSAYARIVREHAGKVDVVAVGGGDGSILLALPGILEIGATLAVIPMGTANNFARNLAIPTSIDSACEVIAQGNVRRVDVAQANGKSFLNVAGLGLSTEVNRSIPRNLKKRWGIFGYIYYALRIARRMRPFTAYLQCGDGERVKIKTFQITVCNGKYYGSGLPVHEEARIDDGKLDLCSTEVRRWWHGLACIPALIRGHPHKHQSLRWVACDELRIETKRRMALDTDGEITTHTPVVFNLRPGILSVFVPKASVDG